jgi:hypothetical protein
VDTAIGLELIFGHGDSGTVTNGRQIWVTTPYDTSAPVTNFDGIRIDDQTYAGSTTNFAIKYNAPHGIAGIGANGSTKIANITFSQLPSAHDIGDLFLVTDSSVTTWGSTVASGGSNKVLVMWNGTNWTVIGK